MAVQRVAAHLARRALDFGELVKFEHTVFALPFALLGAALAARMEGALWPSSRTAGWIVAAMVGARTAAMAFNRVVDARYDAANPRTAGRAIPQGLISQAAAVSLGSAAAALFVLASYNLNSMCFALSPIALAAVLGYSFAKRWTALSHLLLGLAIGIAPTGAWLAVAGRLHAASVLLSLAVAVWVAGFDVLYSLQDVSFDRSAGLRSIPARLGAHRALGTARLLHLSSVLLLLLVHEALRLGPVFLGGIGLAAAMLAYEHTLVRAEDLSRLNTAFFAVNGWLSVSLFCFALLDGVLTR